MTPAALHTMPAGVPVDPRRRLYVNGKSLIVYQVFYDAMSERALASGYNPYFNRRFTRYAENSVIASLIQSGNHLGCDYFGVFSWRFHSKVPLGQQALLERMDRDGFRADVYSFFGTPEIQQTQIWEQTEVYHPGILRIVRELFQRLGITVRPEDVRSPVIYENHFLCRPELYERYCRELLWPCMQLMERDPDPVLQRLLAADAGYRCRSGSFLSPQAMEAIFGKPFFTFHPFICERLFSTWLHLNPDVRVTQIWHERLRGC